MATKKNLPGITAASAMRAAKWMQSDAGKKVLMKANQDIARELREFEKEIRLKPELLTETVTI